MNSSIFKTFFISLAVIANTHFAYCQTASILPPAKTTFTDQNGKPLTSGTVDFYAPGTTTRKTTWQDSSKSVSNANPVVLDAAGRALILGDGAYRQVVKDRNGNLVWDQVTSSIGSGGSGSTIGDGLAVGTILPSSAATAPPNYQFAYGQALSRSSFPELFAALTVQTPIGCVGGSSVLNVSDTSNLSVGAALESICVSGSPTIVSKTSTTVTVTSSSTITVATTGRFFPYGNGDSLTTFNVPDLRGYVAAGRCNMGGINCSVLNSTYFSSNSNNTPSGLNAKGGNQSFAILTANLPPYTPQGGVVTSFPVFGLNNVSGTTDPTHISLGNSANSSAGTFNAISSPFVGSPQGGQSAPFSLIQPTLTLNYLVKVTPDVNLTSSFGVASIGGMTGIIACGVGIVCSSNTISIISPGVTSIQGMTGAITCGAGVLCSSGVISTSSNVISSQTFGAVCDGVTDDTTALSNWIGAINSSTSANVTGTYGPGNCRLNSATLGSGLVITRSRVTIDGGGSTITVFGTSMVNQVFSSSDQSFISYKNLRLVGNSVANTFALGGAIGFTNASAAIQDLRIADSYFENFGGDYWIYVETLGSFSNPIQNIWIDNNYFLSQNGNCRGPTNIAINCSFVLLFGVGKDSSNNPTPNSYVRTASITNNFMRAEYIKTGVQLFNNTQDVTIDGNKIYNNGQLGGQTDDHGSYAIMNYENESPSTSLYSKHSVITNNYIFNARDNCMYIAGQWIDSVISGNVCDTQTSTATTTLPKGGISLNGSVGTTITNNRLVNIAADGITSNAVTGNEELLIVNNYINANINGIRLLNNGAAATKLSVLNNSILSPAGSTGVLAYVFPGGTYTDLKIDGNNISGGAYGIRFVADTGTLTMNNVSVSNNTVQVPTSKGIDISNIAASPSGPIVLNGNTVTGAPSSASYDITSTINGIFQNNVVSLQTVGKGWFTAGAQGTLRNNSFDRTPNANIVATNGATDLGRVVPTFVPTGANEATVVQKFIPTEAGGVGVKYITREWIYPIGSAAWLPQNMLTGN